MTKLAVYLTMMLFSSNFSATTVAKEQPKHHQTQHMQQVVQLTDQEQRFIDLVNSERWSRGLKTLKMDPNLVEVARKHSKEMHDKNYFDHFSPTPGIKTPVDRFMKSVSKRPSWAYVGENLFYCSITDVNRGHQALMDSPTHRENILNSRYEKIGVGIYIAPDGQFWVTEMFLASTD